MVKLGPVCKFMLLSRGFLKEGVAYQYHQLLGSYFIVKQAWADNFLKKPIY